LNLGDIMMERLETAKSAIQSEAEGGQSQHGMQLSPDNVG